MIMCSCVHLYDSKESVHEQAIDVPAKSCTRNSFVTLFRLNLMAHRF